jgi:hypothetical protein
MIWLARLWVLAALPVLLGTSGCNTYKYFDVHVTFDQSAGNFDVSLAGSVDHCRLTVSGADSGTFTLAPGTCPNRAGSNLLDVGVFEYSTFADSGNLRFDVDAFQGANMESEACRIGTGNTTIPVASAMTIAGSVAIKKNGTGCLPPATAAAP